MVNFLREWDTDIKGKTACILEVNTNIFDVYKVDFMGKGEV